MSYAATNNAIPVALRDRAVALAATPRRRWRRRLARLARR